MPRFAYSARDRSGSAVRATLDAASRKDAARILAARGLQVTELSESAGNGPVATTAIARPAAAIASSGNFSRQHRLPFLKALSDLNGSGMPAGEAVRLLSLRLKDPELRALCGKLWERLSEGLPLSRALELYPEVFDLQTVNLISAGEATGNLREVLLRLIQHFTEQKALRSKLTAALAYPVFICLVALGLILFFIFYLLPRLQTLLGSLGGHLPLSTRVLVGLSHFLVTYGLVVVAAAVIGAVIFWRWRQQPAGRAAIDAWLLTLPFAGPFLINSTILNFSQTLAVLLENGVTTAEALRMTERTLTHTTLQQAFHEATDRVLEGESLSLSLHKTGCFPDLVIDQLSVGESTGNLAPSLRDLARNYQAEIATQVQSFTTFFSSAVLMFAFGFVAFIAYAIVSAVFQVSASFKF
jgi:type II secretory pathway component PulF